MHLALAARAHLVQCHPHPQAGGLKGSLRACDTSAYDDDLWLAHEERALSFSRVEEASARLQHSGVPDGARSLPCVQVDP